MGRPVKISKAQAALAITNTTATTNVLTTSNSLSAAGVLPGMTFVPSGALGGLVAGTVYYILKIVTDTTFTLSATPLNANATRTPVTVTTASGNMTGTVGLKDSGFDNPVGSANTYGVVGGNTGLYGSQILCNVAISSNGTGTFFANAGSNVAGFVGSQADSLGSTSVVVVNGTEYALNAAPTVVSFNIVSTATSGEIEVSSVTGIVANLPIKVATAVGGLSPNAVYLVSTIDSDDSFITVTNLDGSAVVLTDATSTVAATQTKVALKANATVAQKGASYTYYSNSAGFIVRQKGKSKYLVQDAAGNRGICVLTNEANLKPGFMSITGKDAANANVVFSTISSRSGAVYGATVAANALVKGTLYTIADAGDTNWIAVGARENLNNTSFVATGAGTGTGKAVLAAADPSVNVTFNAAAAANAAVGLDRPVITVNKG